MHLEKSSGSEQLQSVQIGEDVLLGRAASCTGLEESITQTSRKQEEQRLESALREDQLRAEGEE